MNENNTNKCFNNLQSDDKQLWLNINQNVKTFELFNKLDNNRAMCVNCFQYLGINGQSGFFYCQGYCKSCLIDGFTYCDNCTDYFKLENPSIIIDNVRCPVCWYFQIKNYDNCLNNGYFFTTQCSKPPILLYQWNIVDIPTILQSYDCDP